MKKKKQKVSCQGLFKLFINTIPLGPWFTGWSRFRIWLLIRRENRFENRQNLIPLCQWYILMYFFLLRYSFPWKGMGANNCCREWSRDAIKNPAVSLTPLNLFPLFHWDYTESFTRISKSNPAVSMTKGCDQRRNGCRNFFRSFWKEHRKLDLEYYIEAGSPNGIISIPFWGVLE
jgi:hypothetical protein